MLSRYTMNATPTVTNIKDFKSSDETDETGRTINVNLSWVCETEPAESGWVVTYTLQDVENAEPQTLETDTDSCVIPANNMYPGATYKVTLALKNGDLLDGTTELTFTTANVDNPYTANGVKDPLHRPVPQAE